MSKKKAIYRVVVIETRTYKVEYLVEEGRKS